MYFCSGYSSFFKKKQVNITRARGYKLFSCSPQLSTELINVNMSILVGIFTFITITNATSGSLKARKVFNFQRFSVYVQFKFKQSFITPGPGNATITYNKPSHGPQSADYQNRMATKHYIAKSGLTIRFNA